MENRTSVCHSEFNSESRGMLQNLWIPGQAQNEKTKGRDIGTI